MPSSAPQVLPIINRFETDFSIERRATTTAIDAKPHQGKFESSSRAFDPRWFRLIRLKWRNIMDVAATGVEVDVNGGRAGGC